MYTYKFEFAFHIVDASPPDDEVDHYWGDCEPEVIHEFDHKLNDDELYELADDVLDEVVNQYPGFVSMVDDFGIYASIEVDDDEWEELEIKNVGEIYKKYQDFDGPA